MGTHTHVPTLDTRVLPKGTAYVSDVGMTGPSGGMQGLHPRSATPWMGNRLPTKGKLELVGMCSLAIRRLFPNSKLAPPFRIFTCICIDTPIRKGLG